MGYEIRLVAHFYFIVIFATYLPLVARFPAQLPSISLSSPPVATITSSSSMTSYLRNQRLLSANSGHTAEELHPSINTVSTYRSRILEKMDLIHYAIKNDLIQISSIKSTSSLPPALPDLSPVVKTLQKILSFRYQSLVFLVLISTSEFSYIGSNNKGKGGRKIVHFLAAPSVLVHHFNLDTLRR